MAKTKSKDPSRSLKFDKSIISTIDSKISTKELINRLNILHDELSNVEDATLDFSTYTSDLANKKLLTHSSIGVQAYVCCCLSDILRIFAPNAPYSASQLSDIFRLFFKQFSRLSDKKDDPFYQQHVYLLKRVAEAKSTILITDLPDSENLIIQFFDTFYNLAAKGFPLELETIITDILSEVLAEAETVPREVLELILKKVSNHGSSSLLQGNISSPEFNFSLAICNNNIDRMSLLIARYFSGTFYDSINNGSDEEGGGLTNAMESLKKVHSLSVQLWRFIPAILSSIISLIEEELNADHEKVRLLATATIGQILGSEESLSIKTKVNFFVVHKRVWNNWLKRTTDVSPIVRSQWVQSLPEIVSKNPFLTSEINQMLSTCLHKCLIDSNEKVRESACLSASEIPYQQFMDKLATPDILQTLFELVREKNDTIRETSITVLNSIYSKFVLNDTDDQTELTKLISSIPNQILSLMYIDRPSITALVDLSFFEVLLSSFEPDNGKRVEKMLYLFDSLNDKGVSAFVAINKRQQQISKALLTFIETTETFHSLNNVEDKENNVNNQDQKETVLKLDKITDWLSALFPDSVTAKSCFERFYQLNRARFFHLVKNCINSDSDIPTIKNSMKELLGKLSDPKNIKLENERSKITTKEMVDNFKLLLLRASPIVYNSSNIEELIKYSKNSSHKYYSAANLILEQASSIQPGAFKSHVRELSTLIIGQEINKSNSLKAIYHLTKKYPDMFPQEISFLDSLKSLAVNGTPEEAKYSIKLIGLSDKKEISCTSIIDSIYPLDIDNDNFATHISSIAQIFLVDRFALADKENDITRLLIKDVLLSNRETDTPDETWIGTDDLSKYPALNAKLLAIRLLVNNLKSLLNENMTNDAKEEAEKKASSVFKLLMLLIGNNGELVNKADKSIPTPDPFKSRLRLAAGLSMLKLAKKPFYSELMTPARIRRLTFLMNDENTHVRSKFIESLSKALSSGLISERFIPILFFGALEQNSELKLTIEQWITRSFKDMLAKKNIKFEKALVRLIHILAHHEQFLELTKEGDDEAKLSGYKYASKILSYYVELIANGDNISLLYYLASRVKQQRDVTISASDYEEDTLSEQVLNLYRIAELAQIIIKNYADTKKWSVETWPVDFKLATDMYCPMATSKEAQSIVSQIFIPEVLQLELLKIINKRSRTVGVGIKKANDSTTGPKQGVKRSRAISKKTKTKKPKVVVEPTRRSSRATKDVNYANQLESESGSEFESDDE